MRHSGKGIKQLLSLMTILTSLLLFGSAWIASSANRSKVLASSPCSIGSVQEASGPCPTPVLGSPISFFATPGSAAGSGPVATGDFNGDGKLDVVTANPDFNKVSLLLGDGKGSFSAATNFIVSLAPVSIAVKDFNGDGKLDVVTANRDANTVSVLLGDGRGGFGTATEFAVIGLKPVSIVAGDFNNDGKPDLAVANSASNNLSILLGDGLGHFGTAMHIDLSVAPNAITVGDFNNDGKLDLVVVLNINIGNVLLFLGDGTGHFAAPRIFESLGRQPIFVTVADLNGDGHLDLAIIVTDGVSILLGDGTGSFNNRGSANFGSTSNLSVRIITVADFNGDSKPDLLVGNSALSQTGGYLSILLGDGAGSFGPSTNFPSAGISPFLAVGDFNGDGKPDVVLPNQGVTLLLNGCPASAISNISAASFSAASFATESIVSAFGSNLATVSQPATTLPLPTSIAGTTVRVADSMGNDRPAPLFYVSPTQVNYQIPPGTATGAATIRITSGGGSVSTAVIQITRIAPGIFTANSNGQGVAAAIAQHVKADGSSTFELVAQFDAAQNKYVSRPLDLGPSTDQVFLLLFGTGIRFRTSQLAVIVTIGGVDVPVGYAGAQGDFAGLDQVNVQVPRSLIEKGEVDLVVMVDGQAANTVKLNLR